MNKAQEAANILVEIQRLTKENDVPGKNTEFCIEIEQAVLRVEKLLKGHYSFDTYSAGKLGDLIYYSRIFYSNNQSKHGGAQEVYKNMTMALWKGLYGIALVSKNDFGEEIELPETDSN